MAVTQILHGEDKGKQDITNQYLSTIQYIIINIQAYDV